MIHDQIAEPLSESWLARKTPSKTINEALPARIPRL
jgi:hypothetical protein